MKNLALERIQKMKIYNPPLNGRSKLDGLLLDFNERTIKPTDKVINALRKFLQEDRLQTYPEYGLLEKKLASYAGVNPNQILVTNGSDQAIDIVFHTFTQVNDTVIIPNPSFAMFSQCAQMVGNKIIRPLYTQGNLSFPLKEVLGIINDSVKLIVICNPNNPTGTLIAINDIEKIVQKARNAIILVDEAYFEFSNVTAVPLIKKYPNIIIVRTLSKAFGLASLRIGYLTANDEYIKELRKGRGPYAINMLAYVAASSSLDDKQDTDMYVEEVMKKSKPMIEEFFIKNKIPFYPSSANFILFKPKDSGSVEKTLRNNGILLRRQDKPTIENTLRLSIGTVTQMKKFIQIYNRCIISRKAKTNNNKYAFIDRDGTLIFEPQDTYQIDSIEKLKILDGVIKGLKELIKRNYKLIMVTNQEGLGTSSFSKDNFQEAQKKMLKIFEDEDIKFKKIFICPHLPSSDCSCRKPKIGFVEELIDVNKINKDSSFVCGDRSTDKEFAKNLGVRFISAKTNGNLYEALSRGGIFL